MNPQTECLKPQMKVTAQISKLHVWVAAGMRGRLREVGTRAFSVCTWSSLISSALTFCYIRLFGLDVSFQGSLLHLHRHNFCQMDEADKCSIHKTSVTSNFQLSAESIVQFSGTLGRIDS